MEHDKYSYLDIAVSVVDASGQCSHHSFHGAPVISLPALRDLATHFMDLTEGYMMWTAAGKRSFAYFLLDAVTHESRMLVTLRMDSDMLMGGRQIINLLTSIKIHLQDGEEMTDELLFRLTAAAGFPENPHRCRDAENTESGDKATGVCCRSYSTTSELANIFGFPRQNEYRSYSAVAVVSASVSFQPDSLLPVIDTQLDKSLSVVCPDGVSASAYRVELTDHLTLIYSREGFESVEVTFEVGNTNRYVHISGPALVVNNAEHAGIIFRMRVPYTIVSASGSNIDTYTILVNERTANRNASGFEVTNMDFINGTAKIVVQSTNFGNYEFEVTPHTLTESMPLEIVLEPEARDVLIRLDFGENRIMEFSLTMEKNTREYCGLRAGSFHGFRAHRLMGSKPETYNVDMKPMAQESSVMQQTEVNTQSAEPQLFSEHQLTAPVAPVMEKAPTAIWEEKKHIRRAPEFGHDTPDDEDPRENKTSWLRSKPMKYGLAILLSVVVVWVIISLFFNGSGGSTAVESGVENTDSLASVDSAADSVRTAVPVNVAVSAAETSDIDYLNSHSEWKSSELKTEEYKALIAAFAAGDITAVTSHAYFTTPGRATNTTALSVADMLWNAIGTPTEKSNIRGLRKLGVTDKVNLRDVIKVIERYQPAEPNPAPRPGAAKKNV